MRDIFESGILTEMTQGSIINNCISEDFPTCPICGCVITPRCDLANNKVSTFHYLPIVDFEIWVKDVVRSRLIADHYSKLKEKINTILKNAKIGGNLLDIFQNKTDILKLGASVLKKKKDIENFNKLCSDYFDHGKEAEKNYITNESHYKKIISDLVKNDFHGYYIIESWENSHNFKVIILRDIRRISIDSRKLYENWIDRGFENDDLYRKNDIADARYYKDHYKILCCIKSPFMENIMQAFSYNFTRVGIPSFDEGIKARLSIIIKTVLS